MSLPLPYLRVTFLLQAIAVPRAVRLSGELMKY